MAVEILFTSVDFKKSWILIPDPWLFSTYETWWCHQIETFSALLALWAGNSTVTGELPAQSPVARSFDIFFDLRLNKQLSKQSWGWWFETSSLPLLCHSDVLSNLNCLGIAKVNSKYLWFETPSRPLWRHSNGSGVWTKLKECLFQQHLYNPVKSSSMIINTECVNKVVKWC